MTGHRIAGPVVVVGDILLDRDVEGVVNRLCPDSPVPVLDETTHVERPGGAGLAALFATAQGAEVLGASSAWVALLFGRNP